MTEPTRRREPHLDRDEGPAVREYAIVLVVIALISVVALILFGPQTEHVLSTVSHSV